jgi:hypothetical protein
MNIDPELLRGLAIMHILPSLPPTEERNERQPRVAPWLGDDAHSFPIT